eukprot:g4522.t1
MKKLFFFFLNAIIASSTSDTPSLRVSHPNVLLPYSASQSFNVELEVEAFPSTRCFAWQSTNPTIVSVKPLFADSASVTSKPEADSLEGSCSHRAVLTSLSATRGHKEVSIYITDVTNSSTSIENEKSEEEERGALIVSEVHVNTIETLAIKTTFKKLFVGGEEKISAVGFDAAGNTFDSLEGLRFTWSATPEGILEIIPLEDGRSYVGNLARRLEKEFYSTDAVELRGLKMGKVRVTVSIDEPGYEAVPSSSAEFFVAENLSLRPALPLVVPPGAIFAYNLLRSQTSRRSKQEIVLMPSDKYVWSSSNTTIATFPNNNEGTLHAQTCGDTEISVTATDVDAAHYTKVSALFSVNDPARLVINYVPWPTTSKNKEQTDHHLSDGSDSWQLVTGRKYVVRVQVIDDAQNVLSLGTNMRTRIFLTADEDVEESSAKLFEDIPSDVERACGDVVTGCRVVRALHSGKAKVDSFLEIEKVDGDQRNWIPFRQQEKKDGKGGLKVASRQPIVIVDPIILEVPILGPFPNNGKDKVVLLPWDSKQGSLHTFVMTAKGGSGEFDVSSSDASVAAVGSMSLVQSKSQTIVTSRVRGSTVIHISDRYNKNNFDELNVIVTPLGMLQIPPQATQVLEGEEITIYAQAGNKEGILFANCTEIAGIEWSVDRTDLLSVADSVEYKHGDEESKDGLLGCTSRRFKALQRGRSRVVLKVPGIDQSAEERVKMFEAQVEISVFSPLIVVGPSKTRDGKAFALVGLGDSAQFTISGGPLPAASQPMSYDTLRPENPDAVKIQNISSGGQRMFSITCLTYGEQQIHVNTASMEASVADSKGNESARIARSEIVFACHRPTFMEVTMKNDKTSLEPFAPPRGDWRRWIRGEASPPPPIYVVVPRENDITLELSLFHVFNDVPRRFTNVTTASTEWKIEDSDEKENMVTLLRCDRHEPLCRVRMHGARSGSVHVLASVDGYRSDVLNNVGIHIGESSKWPDGKRLRHIATLALGTGPRLRPLHASLFNHPDSRLVLSCTGGFGDNFKNTFHLNDTTIASFEELSRKEGKRETVLGETLVVRPSKSGQGKTGSLHLIAKAARGSDVSGEEAPPSVAHIFLSSVARLQLRVRKKLCVQRVGKMELIAFDQWGHAFPGYQYKNMNIELEYDHTAVSITYEGSEQHHVTYRLKGLATGSTQIRASIFNIGSDADNEGARFFSLPVELQIVPSLELRPRHLVLLPGSTFMLDAGSGAKLHHDFSVRNSTVATVSNDGHIVARSLGLTDLHARWTYAEGGIVDNSSTDTGSVESDDRDGLSDGQEPSHDSRSEMPLSVDRITVEVAPLSGITIEGPSAAILVGTSAKLHVHGTVGENAFSFSGYGSGYNNEKENKLRFEWSAENLGVVNLQAHNDGFSSWLSAVGVGRTVVYVTVHVHAAGEEPRVLRASYELNVVEPLRLLSPYLLILRPESSVTIRTTRDTKHLRYEVLEQPVDGDGNGSRSDSKWSSASGIKVSSRGVIRAGKAQGRASVRITDNASGQWVVSLVEVRRQAQLTLRPLPPFFEDVPLGSETRFAVELRDSYGRLFHDDPFALREMPQFKLGGVNDDHENASSGNHNAQRPVLSHAVNALHNDLHVGQLRFDPGDRTLVFTGLRQGEVIVSAWMHPDVEAGDESRLTQNHNSAIPDGGPVLETLLDDVLRKMVETDYLGSLRSLFDALDKNSDGYLSQFELGSFFRVEDIENLNDNLGVDDGNIESVEFLKWWLAGGSVTRENKDDTNGGNSFNNGASSLSNENESLSMSLFTMLDLNNDQVLDSEETNGFAAFIERHDSSDNRVNRAEFANWAKSGAGGADGKGDPTFTATSNFSSDDEVSKAFFALLDNDGDGLSDEMTQLDLGQFVEHLASVLSRLRSAAIEELAYSLVASRETASLPPPPFSDFLRVHVHHIVQPSAPSVHVGGHVYFFASQGPGSRSSSRPAATAVGNKKESDRGVGEMIPGTWTVSDASVLQIDHESGDATAIAAGTTTVHFSSSDGRITTETTVTVLQLAAVEVAGLRGGERFLTNVAEPARGSARKYHLQLIMKDAMGQVVKAGAHKSVENNIQLQCSTSVADQQWVDVAVGQKTGPHDDPVCVITPLPPPPAGVWIEAPNQITVQLAVGDENHTYKQNAEWTVPFVAAFAVSSQPPPFGGESGKRCALQRLGETITVTLRGADLQAVSASSSSTAVNIKHIEHKRGDGKTKRNESSSNVSREMETENASLSRYLVTSTAEVNRVDIHFEHPRTRQREELCVSFVKAEEEDAFRLERGEQENEKDIMEYLLLIGSAVVIVGGAVLLQRRPDVKTKGRRHMVTPGRRSSLGRNLKMKMSNRGSISIPADKSKGAPSADVYVSSSGSVNVRTPFGEDEVVPPTPPSPGGPEIIVNSSGLLNISETPQSPPHPVKVPAMLPGTLLERYKNEKLKSSNPAVALTSALTAASSNGIDSFATEKDNLYSVHMNRRGSIDLTGSLHGVPTDIHVSSQGIIELQPKEEERSSDRFLQEENISSRRYHVRENRTQQEELSPSRYRLRDGIYKGVFPPNPDNFASSLAESRQLLQSDSHFKMAREFAAYDEGVARDIEWLKKHGGHCTLYEKPTYFPKLSNQNDETTKPFEYGSIYNNPTLSNVWVDEEVTENKNEDQTPLYASHYRRKINQYQPREERDSDVGRASDQVAEFDKTLGQSNPYKERMKDRVQALEKASAAAESALGHYNLSPRGTMKGEFDRSWTRMWTVPWESNDKLEGKIMRNAIEQDSKLNKIQENFAHSIQDLGKSIQATTDAIRASTAARHKRYATGQNSINGVKISKDGVLVVDEQSEESGVSIMSDGVLVPS